MNKICSIVSLSLAVVMGCELKSGTAPPTDANKPNAVRKLTVMASGDHTITQNETDEIKIAVNRDNFKEPVTVEVMDLPKGVSLDSRDVTIPADQSMITIRLKAALDAPPTKDHIFHIVGKSKDIKSDTLNLKLTVKAK